MAGYRVSGKVEGLAGLVASLRGIDARARKKALRAMVAKGGQVLARAAKRAAPKETGLLKKSVGSKVKAYPSGVAVSVVGPRQGFRQQVTRRKGKRRPAAVTANPVKYAHLVELGTARAAARPFLKPALETSQSAILQAMEQAVKKALGV